MRHQRVYRFITELINDSSEVTLSVLLTKALTIAKQTGDAELEQWIRLEMSGYFDTNSALTSDVRVPNYRRVPGQYHDLYGRPLIINDPDLFQIVNNYYIREGVAELEKLSQKDKLLSFRNPHVNKMINEKFDVDVDSFSYSSNSLISVLTEIRNTLIGKLVEIQEAMANEMSGNTDGLPIHSSLSHLHPIIQQSAGALYNDGHYRQAILDSYIALVDAVKIKSGKHDLDGTSLMQTVFSMKNPVLKVSSNPDEQLGFMWLFSGAVMGIRNPKAHSLIEQNDPQRALEWLSFASVLLRVLDDSK